MRWVRIRTRADEQKPSATYEGPASSRRRSARACSQREARSGGTGNVSSEPDCVDHGKDGDARASTAREHANRSRPSGATSVTRAGPAGGGGGAAAVTSVAASAGDARADTFADADTKDGAMEESVPDGS
jgi:hypothetical protein